MNGLRPPGVRSSHLIVLILLALLQIGGGQNGTLQITMSPSVHPAFDPNVTDYVVNSGRDATVQVSVGIPADTKVSVDRQAYRTSSFVAQVNNVNPGQSFSIVVKNKAGFKTYYFRRIPSDFPAWTTERPGTPQAEYYIFEPDIKTDFSGFRDYTIVADNNGVPIWWNRSGYVPIDGKLLPHGQVGWIAWFPGYAQVRKFDGTVTQTLLPGVDLGGHMDNHELLMLPNGNYLVIVDVLRSPVDLSPYGGLSYATVVDNVIEELTPKGAMVWFWSAMDHIAISETGQQWWQTYLVNSSPADPFHMNSVEVNRSSYVISLRHLNAVISIDRATGDRKWKLGGSPRPESLTYVGDPYGNFGGNHDARILPDGTLTLHDNGTTLGRAPRALRYKIDYTYHTATLIEQITDANAPSSGCCGSARRLVDGNWVMGWGDNPNVTELAPDGSLVFRLNYQDSYFSYRAVPVPYAKIRRADLRHGMDLQFPR